MTPDIGVHAEERDQGIQALGHDVKPSGTGDTRLIHEASDDDIERYVRENPSVSTSDVIRHFKPPPAFNRVKRIVEKVKGGDVAEEGVVIKGADTVAEARRQEPVAALHAVEEGPRRRDEAQRPPGQEEIARSVPIHSISLGAGKERPTARRREVSDVASLAEVLRNHGRDVIEGWWSSHSWRDNRRKGEAWEAACGVVLDLDSEGHVDVSPDLKERLVDAVRDRSLPGNIFHLTPAGARVVFLFDVPTNDRNAYQLAARGAAGAVMAQLRELDIPLNINPKEAEDPARIAYAPNTYAKGRPRSAEVIVLRDEPYPIADLHTWAREYPPDKTSPSPTKDSAPKVNGFAAQAPDVMLGALRQARDLYRRDAGAGKHIIRCPWGFTHTTGDDEAAYFEAAPSNGGRGGFKCLHQHCESRNIDDLRGFLEIDDERSGIETKSSLTDAGNAERFIARHGRAVRYVHGWGRWLLWDGSHWAADERGEIRELMIETARSLLLEAQKAGSREEAEQLVRHALTSQRRDRIMAALDLASSMPPIAVVPDELDRDPDILNVPNGEIDLRTGRLLPHDPAHLTMKLAPIAYDSAAGAPTWDAFLARVIPDPEVRAYVQRAVGYSLTGDVSEHAVFFCYGTGANGKTTFLETCREMLGEGEYAKAAQPDLLLAKRQDRHPVERADLRGMRLVSAMEAGEGRSWDEARVKELTGGDTISARLMYGSPFSFTPSHKFWVAANHKPRVSGTDLGFWRRVHLIPFTVTIPEAERDPDLRAKLRAELPGILRWAVEGALEWRRGGLRPPPAVTQATKEYRSAEDVIGAFLDECTTPGEKVEQPALYKTYRAWAERSGERYLSARAFGEALEERGFQRKRTNGRTWIFGLSLRQEDAITFERASNECR